MLYHLITATNISTGTGLQPHELWHLLLQQRIFGPAVNQCLDLLPWPVGSSYHGAPWHLGIWYPKHRSSIDILMEVQGSSSFPHRPKDQSLWRSISTSFPVAIRCEAFGIRSGDRGSNSTSHTNNGAIHNLVGGIPTPLKNISQLGWLSHILWKIKNVPKHQPATLCLPKNISVATIPPKISWSVLSWTYSESPKADLSKPFPFLIISIIFRWFSYLVNQNSRILKWRYCTI